HARGQKMWMTDAGDISLLDLRHCEFDAPPTVAEH
ncbi:MAG: ImpE protein, partial [Variovorax sp.]|nr:ImpE protein [Variovorax sp.]